MLSCVPYWSIYCSHVTHLRYSDLLDGIETVRKNLISLLQLSNIYQLKQLDTSYRIISNINRRAEPTAKRSTYKT